MSDGFNWTCPTCGSHTTITEPNFAHKRMDVIARNSPDNMGVELVALLIECPNQACRAQFFSVEALYAKRAENSIFSLRPGESRRPVGIGKFTFLPTTVDADRKLTI